jgi:hypothetical protein
VNPPAATSKPNFFGVGSTGRGAPDDDFQIFRRVIAASISPETVALQRFWGGGQG